MDFLQSKIWREFQAAVGREVFEVDEINILKHTLPVVGDYFYIPRVEVESSKKQVVSDLINLAKKENVGWIRIEPETESALNTIKNSLGSLASKLVKAPHDMQPRETLVIDISKSEEDLLSEMKQKTRYNLNLAKKKDIKIIISREKKYVDEFLSLVKITSLRDGIKSHEEKYYRQMVENIPAENLKIYLAEYEGKLIAANLVIFFQDTVTYLHGASDNEYRNVMAPYLLQWKQIQDAKEAGCTKYDFGGIKTSDKQQVTSDKASNWAGITKFKLGFSPNTEPTRFPGCYDIVLKQLNYALYRTLQKIKTLF